MKRITHLFTSTVKYYISQLYNILLKLRVQIVLVRFMKMKYIKGEIHHVLYCYLYIVLLYFSDFEWIYSLTKVTYLNDVVISNKLRLIKKNVIDHRTLVVIWNLDSLIYSFCYWLPMYKQTHNYTQYDNFFYDSISCVDSFQLQ